MVVRVVDPRDHGPAPEVDLAACFPANARIASSVPTAAIRSPRIASASAKGAAGSAVKILP